MNSARRSRMRRTPAGKRIALTSRDIEVFRALRRYRYLRSSYLHAFVGGASETRFKERLGHLFHEGLLDRPAKQWEFAAARYMPAVYEIGDRARGILAENACADPEGRTFLSATAHRQFPHSVMICECLASIELAAFAQPGLRFISWSEILARAPEGTRESSVPYRIPVSAGACVIPDGVFGLEYQSQQSKAYRFFAVEVDRGTMPIERSNERQTSVLGKLAAYRQIMARQIHKTHLGLPNFLVLTLTVGEQRMAEMIRRLEIQGGENAPFLFKAIAESGAELSSPSTRWLLEPWQRVGRDELAIAI
jgi:hypothetical protein